MKTKKNEILIGKSKEGYSLHYVDEDADREPKPIINGMEFYNIIRGLIEIPKNIYKNGTKFYFNECDLYKISKKEKKIFRGLINILEKFAIGKENLEYKIEEIKNTLINQENKENVLIQEISRNKEKSFNSLYKITKV